MVTVSGLLSGHYVVAIRDGDRIWGDFVLQGLGRQAIAEGDSAEPKYILPARPASFDDDDSFATTIVDLLDQDAVWRVQRTRRWPPLGLMIEAAREHHRWRSQRRMTTYEGTVDGRPVVVVLAGERAWGDPELLKASYADTANVARWWQSDGLTSPDIAGSVDRGLWRRLQIKHLLDDWPRTQTQTAWLPPLRVLLAVLATRLRRPNPRWLEPAGTRWRRLTSTS